VNQLLKCWTRRIKVEIDLFDKQILFHLSKGTKSKDITQYIPISINAIEVRKSNLKELLEVIDGTDLDLVREARNLGLLF
jgi:DNA-binding NarL/FixJ family response regulator